MFEGAVLGVDPGIATAGLAVVAARGGRPTLVWSRTVRTPAGLEEAGRLRMLYGTVRDAISEHHPAALAVERLMWGRNVGSAMSVARATGVILLAAADAGIPVEEYAPLEVKMAVTGIGNAGKDQVRTALVRTHGMDGIPVQPDAADAAAVAFCHLTQSPLRRMHRDAARADVREALAKVTPLALASRRRLPRWDEP
ncbi:MAG TPA: crossover junction endodeoxyribonuclease RuvC [Actinomycetota bacterium]